MAEFAPTFRFKQFAVTDRRCGMKVGTDGVLLGAWCGCPDATGSTVLDVGAGCGLIALIMAQRFPDAAITGVEIDNGAVEDFRDNLANSPWESRIMIRHQDFLGIEGQWDVIVSNPPYFTNGATAPDSRRALARHAEGLSPVSLIDFAAGHLTTDGTVSLILPVEEADALIGHAAFMRLHLSRRADVGTSPRRGVTRCMLEFSKQNPPEVEHTEIFVNSARYKELTKDFYLHF